jgi:hypothetical protein
MTLLGLKDPIRLGDHQTTFQVAWDSNNKRLFTYGIRAKTLFFNTKNVASES